MYRYYVNKRKLIMKFTHKCLYLKTSYIKGYESYPQVNLKKCNIAQKRYFVQCF